MLVRFSVLASFLLPAIRNDEERDVMEHCYCLRVLCGDAVLLFPSQAAFSADNRDERRGGSKSVKGSLSPEYSIYCTTSLLETSCV